MPSATTWCIHTSLVSSCHFSSSCFSFWRLFAWKRILKIWDEKSEKLINTYAKSTDKSVNGSYELNVIVIHLVIWQQVLWTILECTDNLDVPVHLKIGGNWLLGKNSNLAFSFQFADFSAMRSSKKEGTHRVGILQKAPVDQAQRHVALLGINVLVRYSPQARGSR